MTKQRPDFELNRPGAVIAALGCYFLAQSLGAVA